MKMKRMDLGLGITVIAVTFLFIPFTVTHAEDYYVDATGGSDANTGTSTAAAWQTISKVNSAVLQPGDNVYFKRGETFVGTLAVAESGATGNPITFGAYGSGTKPMIAPSSGRAITIVGVSYVDIENIQATNPTNDIVFFNTSPSNITFTNFEISTSSGSGFYFYGGTITGITIRNATSTNVTTAFNLATAVTNSTFTNLYVSTSSNAGLNTSSTGISDVLIEDSVFEGNQDGIKFGSLSSITISNSVIQNNISYGINRAAGGTAGTITIQDSILSSNGNSGFLTNGTTNTVYFLNSTSTLNSYRGLDLSAPNITISTSTLKDNVRDGLYITNGTTVTVLNSIFDNNGTGETGSGNGIFVGGSGTTTISESTFSNNHFDGIGGGGTAYIECNSCTITSNGVDGIGGDGDGFSLHDSSTGMLLNSIISDNKKGGVVNITASNIEIYNNLFTHTSSGTVPVIYLTDSAVANIYNNTFINLSQEGSAITPQDSASSTIRNNIVYGFNIGINENTSGTFSESNNYAFNVGTTPFQSFTPDSTSSSTTDPLFTNVGSGDYTLQSTSPAINTGTTTSRTTDYAGNTIYGVDDIGAYEYQWIAPTSAFTSSASGLSVTFADTSTDSDGTIASWSWDFGDSQTSTSQNPSHEYADSGDYTVTLVVTDNHGATATTTDTVSVSRSSSGSSGGIHYGCTDENASNYERFARHKQSLCVYGSEEGSENLETLEEQLARLQAQLAALQKQKEMSGTTCVFSRNLQLHSTGEDVRCLQQYLNTHGFTVSPSGPGSPGNETQYFGNLTYNALVNFQNAHAADILTRVGLTQGSGYFGPSTRTFINGN